MTLDKAEQGLDLLQNAIQNVCGTDEHWFDFALQMSPYETFDYVRKNSLFCDSFEQFVVFRIAADTKSLPER